MVGHHPLFQALNQHNLTGAAETIERLCAAHADTPRRVARALTALADWQPQSAPNREAARALFERIRVSFPDHPVAIDAAQRLAHLPSGKALDDQAGGLPSQFLLAKALEIRTVAA